MVSYVPTSDCSEMRRTADSPRKRASNIAATSQPCGEATPKPVIATRRLVMQRPQLARPYTFQQSKVLVQRRKLLLGAGKGAASIQDCVFRDSSRSRPKS